MHDPVALKDRATELAGFAAQVAALSQTLSNWHWDNAADVLVSPHDTGRQIATATDHLADAAQTLYVAAGRYAEAADRAELAQRRQP